MPSTEPSAPAAVVLARRDFDAALFDLDGVVTRTAEVHAAAWKRLFDALVEPPFTPEDYQRYVDGRPRLDGIRCFLASRGLSLPEGTPEDGPEAQTVHGLGKRKNTFFTETLEQRGVGVFANAVGLLERLRAAGFRTAVVSASRNCVAVLRAARLEHLFDARVDGVEAGRLGLPGKPAPDTFLEAARRLGVAPERAVVLEDAQAGVQAGRRGHFGLVLGVRRAGPEGALVRAGADVEVTDLSTVRVEEGASEVRPMREVPSALERREELLRRMEGREVAVFLDYDGTLTPIVPQPEDARLSDAMRATLAELARRYPVAAVSGRDLPVLKGFVQLEGLYFAGSHGFDIEGPGGRCFQQEEGMALLPEVDAAERELARGLEAIPGTRLERKRFTVAVHWRHVEEARVPEVERVVASVLARHPRLRRSGGKKVFELQPDIDWHKGRAVQWLLRALGLEREGVLPVFVGDDLTDEDAFQTLKGRGLGVVVRGEAERPTAADYALADVEEVRQFLQLLIARAGGTKR
ncbi:trehalose-phosphatase [Archangium lipolyticum]|uniref:trehalose-phosphatase n=1 Tax=Archangium lipolyticum TaxID=2970465 RepID=UPI00214A1E6D|nr:trehalose-phosphatase [Archangium lipolyticum]